MWNIITWRAFIMAIIQMFTHVSFIALAPTGQRPKGSASALAEKSFRVSGPSALLTLTSPRCV